MNFHGQKRSNDTHASTTDPDARLPLPTRLMAGLAILKHMCGLSDEVLCERWVENPYISCCAARSFSGTNSSFGRSPIEEAAHLSRPSHARYRSAYQRRPGQAGRLRPIAVSGACRARSVRNSGARRSIACTRRRSKCIGKGKAHRPYEFGVKVSVATPLYRSKGGPFVAHVKALTGNPRAHARKDRPRHRKADRREPVSHCRRPRLLWPQRAGRAPVQGLHFQPEAARHRTHQA